MNPETRTDSYSKYSLNDFIVVEPYKQGQGLKEEVKNGFAMVAQKVSLAGLTVLIDAQLKDGSVITKGSIVFIPEEILFNASWAKTIRKSELTDGKDFITIELKYVTAVKGANA